MAMSREEIFSSVQETLVDALAVEPEEVTEDATLTGDLGAESIDFLDIVFRLEKCFNIKIPRGELFPDDLLNNPDYVSNGKFTPAGLMQIKKAMPHADFTNFENDPDVNRMSDLFTVKTLVNYIEAKLAA
ncbi:MAG TPA: acyl carrier protein [Phycisphaerae bacterium]|nr:acyl carrier protein [Phycisphaerae bacterium]HOJ72588.1 acyl carrier protein [Phycisphaerae bacterium]HOM49751.1 acyl carrier protein [Phycisphaerae bacterium]HON64957.1 acyl carrier protein [Phycisphaerae bacterium]HOQ84804.1 acyl carrier protein [Phycisphaerae bacterium]